MHEAGLVGALEIACDPCCSSTCMCRFLKPSPGGSFVVGFGSSGWDRFCNRVILKGAAHATSLNHYQVTYFAHLLIGVFSAVTLLVFRRFNSHCRTLHFATFIGCLMGDGILAYANPKHERCWSCRQLLLWVTPTHPACEARSWMSLH
jgi:hypothetical protein